MSLGESSETASSRSEFQGRMAQKLFPYHLAEYVCRVMRVSPFRYYCDMIFEVMKNEQPYDSIPNFSAADALRLTGIGRNEFIDIMNKCRSKVQFKNIYMVTCLLVPTFVYTPLSILVFLDV
ncbi:protein FAM91A1-like [Camellia sinensis]|uniref:protein FAM91A1-like n=1 Tax=Camellia sinensis TaxID=4442 RepID=UPI001036685D|nr:protein FAM91A1-like [Camellia sinensis]